jgi:1-aminocyclopropane-1-carboxylate deaminase/D-cysteine desulfhydrase-like pyridoxal-dependent ACC family enzyme
MTLPIAERFEGAAALPRAVLCDLPTPLEPLALELDVTDRSAAPATLLVKRDDLTSRTYGGNKARKLELLLGEALAEGSRSVMTFGAYGSNHALATAVHATELGIEPHVVLSPQEPGPFSARVLRAHAGLGTMLHLTAGWDGSGEAKSVSGELARRDGVEPLVIPLGGTNALGASAYVNAAFELVNQSGDGALDVIYVAGGTLGTAVGLALGLAAAGKETRVVAVRVTPGEVASEAFAEKLAGDTVAFLRGLDPGFPALGYADLALELRHDWFGPGYGIVTPEAAAAVALGGGAGLKLETTYTGKALAALDADARDGRLAGLRVLFWDTYNSAELPPAGPDELLPPALRRYVVECDRLFGATGTGGGPGDAADGGHTTPTGGDSG